MFERWFIQNKKREGLNPRQEKGRKNLSTKWTKKVEDSLVFGGVGSFGSDGITGVTHFDYENKITEEAVGMQNRESVIVSKIKNILGSFRNKATQLAVPITILASLNFPLYGLGAETDTVVVPGIIHSKNGSPTGSQKIREHNKKTREQHRVAKDFFDAHTKYIQDISIPGSDFTTTIPETIKSVPPIRVSTENLGIDAITIREVLLTLPRGFLANIEGIKYQDTKIPMPAQYHKKNKFEAAHASRLTRQIILSVGSAQSTLDYMLNDVMLHESAHLNDLQSNKFLCTEDRIKLFRDIFARISSPDRFRSYYVEGIHIPDKKEEALTKSSEYFAEIVATYLSDQYDYLPEADRAIVKELILKTDPEFDRAAASARRLSIMEKFIRNETKRLAEHKYITADFLDRSR